MESLSKLNEYIIELSKSDTDFINHELQEFGVENWLNKQLEYLDCSKTLSNGMRIMQTIGYPYSRAITCYMYVLNTIAGNDFDVDKNWINKLLEQHDKNVEFEKENPPVWYSKKYKQASEKRKREKKVKEELSPSQSLKNKIAQFKGIKFTIKPKLSND